MSEQSQREPLLPLKPSVMEALKRVRLGQLPPGHRISLVDDLWKGERVSPQVLAADLRRLQDAGILVDVTQQGGTVAQEAQEKAKHFEREIFFSNEWPGMRRRLDDLGLTVDELLAR